MPFGNEKLEWLGYPAVKNNLKILFIRFDIIHERDGHRHTDTHTQTPHDSKN